jgi:hypothetical protein
MVLKPRKWRLLLGAALLILTGALIFGWAGPALYALQKAEPAPIITSAQLEDSSLAGRFATVEGRPDLTRVVTVHEAGVTTYWIPLVGYDNRLFVTSTHREWQAATREPVLRFTGKVVRLSSAPDYDAFKRLAKSTAIVFPDDAYALLEGEEPETYRPMVPVVGGLLILWLVVFIFFVQVWHRRQPRSHVTS